MTDDESESEAPMTNSLQRSSTAATADDLDYSTSAVLNNESLMTRKMEQFDQLLDDNCIGYDDFGTD
jgi:hypothetical protein